MTIQEKLKGKRGIRNKKLFVPQETKFIIKETIRSMGYTIKGYCNSRNLSLHSFHEGYFSDLAIRQLIKDGIISNDVVA